MNRLLFILFLFALNAGAQPLWRAPWTTNVPPALISVNDANGGGITNIGANGAHYGLWHFYGNDSNTIARLGDLTSGGSAGGESNATYLVLGLTNALPNAKRLLADMSTILQLTNGTDIIHRVSDTISNWGRFDTNMVSTTSSNAAQNIADGKISIQGGAGNNNILTNLTLQNSASVFSPNAGATFPFGIGQSGNDLVFSHPDTTDQILMTSTGLVANGSAVTNLPTSLTNATHYDLTAGSKGLKTLGAGNGIAITNEAGSNLVAAINPAVVASQANLTAASNTLQTSISDLQGSTNGLNTRVGNLEGATNGLNSGKIDKLNGTGTNFSASLFTGTTNSPLVARDTNSQPLGFEIVSNGVAIFGTNFQSALLISNNLGTVTLTESNSATSKITMATAGIGIGTNTPKGLLSVAVPNSNTLPVSVSGVFGQQTNLLQWETNGILVGAVKSNGCILIPDGTVNFPGIGFASQDDGTGWGIYRAIGGVKVTVNGTEALAISSQSTTINSSAGYFALNNDVTLYYINASRFAIGIGGAGSGFGSLSISNLSAVGTIYATNGVYAKGSNGATFFSIGGTLSVNTTTIANAGTAQTNLITYSVPANQLTNASDRITFTATGRFAANADAKELLVIFGSETILDTTSQIVNSGSWTLKGEIIRTGNTAQSAWAEFNGAGLSLFTDASSVALAQTNGIATLLAIAATCGGSGDATNRTLTVQYWPAP